MSAVTVGGPVRPSAAAAAGTTTPALPARPVLARAHAGIDLAVVVRCALRPLGRFPLEDLAPACRWAARTMTGAAALTCVDVLFTWSGPSATDRFAAAAAHALAKSLLVAAVAGSLVPAAVAVLSWAAAARRHRSRCLRAAADIGAATTPVTVAGAPGEPGSALVWLGRATRLHVPPEVLWAEHRSADQLPAAIRDWVRGLPPAVTFLVATTDQAVRDLHEQIWACVDLLEHPGQVALAGSESDIAAHCARIDRAVADLRRSSRQRLAGDRSNQGGGQAGETR